MKTRCEIVQPYWTRLRASTNPKRKVRLSSYSRWNLNLTDDGIFFDGSISYLNNELSILYQLDLDHPSAAHTSPYALRFGGRALLVSSAALPCHAPSAFLCCRAFAPPFGRALTFGDSALLHFGSTSPSRGYMCGDGLTASAPASICERLARPCALPPNTSPCASRALFEAQRCTSLRPSRPGQGFSPQLRPAAAPGVTASVAPCAPQVWSDQNHAVVSSAPEVSARRFVDAVCSPSGSSSVRAALVAMMYVRPPF